MQIKMGQLEHPAVVALLNEHEQRMREQSPPESRHVFDVEKLKQPEITFWTLWHDEQLLGCAALKHWNAEYGEIKSMKTAPEHTRKGVGQHLMQHILDEAQSRGYQCLKLETGSMAYFEPARNFYQNFGFRYCEPFGHYLKDPNNVFMSLLLN